VSRLAVLAALLVLAAPGQAAAARFGVGVLPGWSAQRLADRLEAATGRRPTTLIPGSALVVEARSRAALARVPGVAYVAPLDVKRRPAFTTNDPLAPLQWYLAADKAFDFWPTFPQLATVKVAVVDSGIDAGHPEFAGRIADGRSFVGGSWRVDTNGHGTFTAGEIAAAVDNNVGIAGIAFSAQLLIAKVVDANGDLPLQAEVAGIRWAADAGAQVINLSLGGVRDPLDPKLDTYSPLEQAAVDYAVRKGAVVVAAVGNGPQSPATPWPYALYPAALPHVIGVSAVTQTGDVPDFSNRDVVYNDLAAPGVGIVSTVPRDMTADNPACADQGYSPCGTDEFAHAIGTSFSAPQVSAAAALVLAARPGLRPEQVATLLERNADDTSPATGCGRCPVGRDALSGWGTLDVQRAVQAATSGPLPPTDAYETNDEAGPWAFPLWGPKGRTIKATLDFWDDQLDVYSIVLRKGQRLYARLGPSQGDVALELWKPGTTRIEGLAEPLAQRAAVGTPVGRQERIAYTARAGGTYFLAARLQAPTPLPDAYTLSFSKVG
jgi:subtilisin family serine protease